MSQLNNLSFYHKKLKKEEQNKPKTGRRKEIIKTCAETDEIEKRKLMENFNESKTNS